MLEGADRISDLCSQDEIATHRSLWKSWLSVRSACTESPSTRPLRLWKSGMSVVDASHPNGCAFCLNIAAVVCEVIDRPSKEAVPKSLSVC